MPLAPPANVDRLAALTSNCLQVPSGSATETQHDSGGILSEVSLPSRPGTELLTPQDMLLLAVQPAPATLPPAAAPLVPPGLQLPPLLPAASPTLSARITHAEETLHSLGISAAVSPAASGDAQGESRAAQAPPAVVALAQLQQAAGVAFGHHHTSSALGDSDAFIVLVLALYGGSPGRLPEALAAVTAAPVGRFVWPAYSAAAHGPAPLLQLAAATRVLLAREDRAVFSALEAAEVTNELLLQWLQELLLPVLSVPAAAAVVAIVLVRGPLMLAAVAVALLQELRAGILQRAAVGDPGELLEWLLAVHCFDANGPDLLNRALALDARHRHDLLPLLLDPVHMP